MPLAIQCQTVLYKGYSQIATHVATTASWLVAPCTIYHLSLGLQRPHRRSHRGCKHPCSRYRKHASRAFTFPKVDTIRQALVAESEVLLDRRIDALSVGNV